MSTSSIDLYRCLESYDVTLSTYDQTRMVRGLKILMDVLVCSPRPLDAQRLLDAGCSTGNCLLALRDHVASVVGLEYSEGILARARQKSATMPEFGSTRAQSSRCRTPTRHSTPCCSTRCCITSTLDPTGPLREAWRNGDSTWSLTTPAELASALAQVQAMETAGTAADFISSRELRRARVGQTVYVYGWR